VLLYRIDCIFSAAFLNAVLVRQVAQLTRDSATEHRDDKMATASDDKPSDIMYFDGNVGPHLEIYE